MIEEQAVVVGVERNDALLEVVRQQPCGLCGQTRGCGVSLWGRLLGHRAGAFRAANPISAQAGDMVVVGIDEQALLSSSVVAYVIPLCALLAGAVLAGMFAPASGNGDWNAVGGAACGLGLGLLWLRHHAARRWNDQRSRPVVLRAADTGAQYRSCHRGD